MSFRVLDLLALVALLLVAWLGWRWVVHEPVPEVKPWRPFMVSFGEQGPCWRSRYEVVCAYTPPWRTP